jgi:hypothetical protein
MQIDILIRTYPKDYEWLHLALASIQKHVTGYRNIVICTPNKRGLEHLTAETVVQVPDLPDGYIGQQLTKLEAWKYTDADAVVFWDSDVIAIEPLDVNEYFENGKPIIWKTRYAEIQCPWQPITEQAMGYLVEWEYMRRMPLVYNTKTLKNVCMYLEEVHKLPLFTYLSRVPYRSFSEFNVMGAFAEVHEPKGYVFKDTNGADMPKIKAMQFWSWGGITNDVLAKIK